MPRPLIGLTTYAEEARFGLQDTFSAVLPLSYVHAVHESGGRAVLITPDAPDPDVLDGLHGIMFTGGSDVDPALYGAEPHATTRVKPVRDKAEMIELWRTFSISSLTTDSHRVRFAGDTAMVTGTQTEDGTERMLFTRVYVKGPTGWQLLSSMQYLDPNQGRTLNSSVR